nr:unnamed protein product [Callosobruchus analis]
MPTYKWDEVEEILEYVFKDTTIKICVYHFERHRQNRKKKIIEPKNSAQKGKMSSQKHSSGKETVIVSGDGQSYANLVRELRKDVDLNGHDVELAKKGSADALRSAINTQLRTGRGTKVTRQTVLYLRELDSLITKEEIMDTLKETYGEVTQRCKSECNSSC